MTSILKLPRLTSIWRLGWWWGGGWALLTLTLELWQNDIFLILMCNNFTICRIMQLIFRVFLWLISSYAVFYNYKKIVYRIINSHRLFSFLSSKVWRLYIFEFACSVQTVHCTLHNRLWKNNFTLYSRFEGISVLVWLLVHLTCFV